VDDGRLRAMLQASGLDAWAVDAVEAPDEAEHLCEVARPVVLAGLKHPRRGAPGAGQSWPVEPDHEVGAGSRWSRG